MGDGGGDGGVGIVDVDDFLCSILLFSCCFIPLADIRSMMII